MAGRTDLMDWVYDALEAYGGKAKMVDVAKHIWLHHEADLKMSGNLFYTWQYDMRWAANRLRNAGKVTPSKETPRGTWAIKL